MGSVSPEALAFAVVLGVIAVVAVASLLRRPRSSERGQPRDRGA